MTDSSRWQQARRATLVGAVVNALLGLAKVSVGFWGNSHALVADGIHSFSDLITDALVIFAARFSNEAADLNHPYGHQRIETAASMFLAMLLILVGFGISWDSLDQLSQVPESSADWLVLATATASILANEALYRYTRFVGMHIQSNLIIANAWHHRSDAASSVIVLIGLIGVSLGFGHLDALAAILVGLMIIKMGMTLGWDSIKELIDTGVEPKKLAKISQLIEQVPGVVAIHQLRTRSMGGEILVDVHVLVKGTISVSEGHHVAQNVHANLQKNIEKIRDVTVHIDPEDDETCCPSQHLPPREQLLPQLLPHWQHLPHFDKLDGVVLHYLDGKISLELKFHSPDEPIQDYTLLYRQAISEFRDITELTLLYRVDKL